MSLHDYDYFEVTAEHVALLRRAYVSWDDCETGAPAIDPKRPYGNSDVPSDMLEILGSPRVDEDNEIPEETLRRLKVLHAETQTALQIFLRTGAMKPGKYRARKYYADWALVPASEGL